MTPSVALLQLDKTAAELAHERHLAKYIRERLSLLGQLDSNKLLHLVFLLSPQKNDGTVEKVQQFFVYFKQFLLLYSKKMQILFLCVDF